MPITDLESLCNHLQWALELEHTTIPPYMSALYSINAGHNTEASEILSSILVEEMLHMALVANLLNAVGGKPVLDKPDFIAAYPTFLPHSDHSFKVGIAKFSPETIETFMKIELPAPHGGMPEDENYETIGQFYEAIEKGFVDLVAKLGPEQVFIGDPKRQFSPGAEYYGGAGYIVAVNNLDTALKAIKEIVEQGEGMDHRSILDGNRNMFHPERTEVAHYFRLQQILLGRYYQQGDSAATGPTGKWFDVDWSAVHNIKPNSSSGDYPDGSSIRAKMDAFNAGYSSMLRLLDRSFNGESHMFGISIGVMCELKVRAAEIMTMPSGDGYTTMGPSFDYMSASEQKAEGDGRIVIRHNGPYVVYGSVPLTLVSKACSAEGESLAWAVGETLQADDGYALCRCGRSSSKPFCDGTHARVGFDGRETAPSSPIAERQEVLEGVGITVKSDRFFCMHAGFCNNKITSMRELLPDSADVRVRTQIVSMVEHCPSGTLTYQLTTGLEEDRGDIEPRLMQAIGVLSEGTGAGGPLWVTGGISVERSDGEPVEVRNRMTLCRCGASKKKPFCDGSHNEID